MAKKKKAAKRTPPTSRSKPASYYESAAYKKLVAGGTQGISEKKLQGRRFLTPEESIAFRETGRKRTITRKEAARNLSERKRAGIESKYTPSTLSSSEAKRSVEDYETISAVDAANKKADKTKAKQAWREKKRKEAKNTASKKSEAATKSAKSKSKKGGGSPKATRPKLTSTKSTEKKSGKSKSKRNTNTRTAARSAKRGDRKKKK